MSSKPSNNFSDESSDDDSVKDYQIMEFVKRGRKPINRRVRIVPKPWIDVQQGKIKAKYMEEPCTETDEKFIKNLAKQLLPAPADWSWFTVLSIGHAETYEEAEERLKTLDVNEYAFTNDSEDPEKKVAKNDRKLKNKKLVVTSLTRKALKVLSLTDSEGEGRNKEDSQSISSGGTNEYEQKLNNETDESSSFSEDPRGTNRKKKKRTKHSNTRLATSNKNVHTAKSVSKSSHVISIDKASEKPKLDDTSAKPIDIITETVNRKEKEHLQIETCKRDKPGKSVYHSKKNEDLTKNSNATAAQKVDLEKKKVLERKITDTKNTPTTGLYNSSKMTLPEILLRRLDRLEVKIDDICSKQDRIIQSLEISKVEVIKSDFITTYNLQLPFHNNVGDFTSFEKQLKDDMDFRNGFKKCLSSYFDIKRVLRKSLTSIVRKFLSKNLALQFTVTKKMEHKELISETMIYQCIFEVLKVTHMDTETGQEVTTKIFNRELGTVLRGAKDWDGGRKSRLQINPLLERKDTSDLDEIQ